MAILYRMNAQSRITGRSARQARDCLYYGWRSKIFYDRAEIKDIMAYLKVLGNMRDDISLRRIINTPKRGIGATTVEKLSEYASEHGISLFEAVMAADDTDVTSSARQKLQKFSALIFGLLNAVSMEGDVFQLIQKVLDDTGYLRNLQKSDDPQSESREENLGELLSVARDFMRNNPDGEPTAFT